MRILIAHNRYRQPGGEDAVVRTEFNLLKDFGQEVKLYERSNDEINDDSFFKKMRFDSGNRSSRLAALRNPCARP